MGKTLGSIVVTPEGYYIIYPNDFSKKITYDQDIEDEIFNKMTDESDLNIFEYVKVRSAEAENAETENVEAENAETENVEAENAETEVAETEAEAETEVAKVENEENGILC